MFESSMSFIKLRNDGIIVNAYLNSNKFSFNSNFIPIFDFAYIQRSKMRYKIRISYKFHFKSSLYSSFKPIQKVPSFSSKFGLSSLIASKVHNFDLGLQSPLLKYFLEKTDVLHKIPIKLPPRVSYV